MNEIDAYKRKLNANGGSSDTTSTQDYYNLAREQEYDTLFNKEVALENAKSNALKYTQNQINAQGFGGTGYGSSLQSGVYNTYLNKVGNAQTEYQTNMMDINQKEKEAMETQDALNAGNINAMIQGASSQSQLDQLLAGYKYGTIDDNGNFSWGAKPEGMSDQDWLAMQYYYTAQKDMFDQSKVTGAEFSFGDNAFMYTDANGKNYRSVGNGKDLVQELNATRMGIATGQIPSGSYIHLQSKQGKHIFMKYENGKTSYISKADYDKANKENCYYCYGRDEVKNEKK